MNASLNPPSKSSPPKSVDELFQSIFGAPFPSQTAAASAPPAQYVAARDPGVQLPPAGDAPATLGVSNAIEGCDCPPGVCLGLEAEGFEPYGIDVPEAVIGENLYAQDREMVRNLTDAAANLSDALNRIASLTNLVVGV